ncbi:MAG: hypothetical protein R3253_17005 [Longimicrobiales bacterium]|nr:hypothetical protein [Longimicrobiales bacterium]
MNAIATHAESVLHSAPHPALRLSELLEAVTAQLGTSVTRQRLRTALEDYPDRFRILEAWKGPWRVREGGSTDAWVVAVSPPETPPDAPPSALRLRESVRWVALGMDGRSRMETSRWYAIAMAERAARRAVVRRAA